ncbi:hypothetical protein CBR_g46727 [Chara braunii]|uniref:Uncharacterized protein n=1 Tax=Chara braunii TaxID=69332 RepID=A0A388K404_CHABU|nr:hypothetical protein CBR_g46727 [Chara braunii]|eukprot:GBG64771.1 hypothetical protein CBR_g46727 [Chara braunii]
MTSLPHSVDEAEKFLALVKDYAAENKRAENFLRNLRVRSAEVQADVEREAAELARRKLQEQRAEEEREGMIAELTSIQAIANAKKERVEQLQSRIAEGNDIDDKLSGCSVGGKGKVWCGGVHLWESFIEDMMHVNNTIRSLKDKYGKVNLEEKLHLKKMELKEQQQRLQAQVQSATQKESGPGVDPGAVEANCRWEEISKLKLDISSAEAELSSLMQSLSEKKKEHQAHQEKYETFVLDRYLVAADVAKKNAELDELNRTLRQKLQEMYKCENCGHDNLVSA